MVSRGTLRESMSVKGSGRVVVKVGQ
jgi:hypothetical protein